VKQLLQEDRTWSQKKLGDAIGVFPAHLAHWLRGSGVEWYQPVFKHEPAWWPGALSKLRTWLEAHDVPAGALAGAQTEVEDDDEEEVEVDESESGATHGTAVDAMETERPDTTADADALRVRVKQLLQEDRTWSQKKLGDAIGVFPAHLACWLRGRHGLPNEPRWWHRLHVKLEHWLQARDVHVPENAKHGG